MIFGIGLGKTGTTSLCRALQLMGFDALHGPETHRVMPNWPKGDFRLTRPVDALVDSAFTRHFALADHLFPKSFFILTIRERGSWLASCQQQMKSIPNANTHAYAMRLASSGIAGFNADAMSLLFEQHYRSVISFFAGRDDALLVVDITATPSEDLWSLLSRFLNRSAPRCPFPDLNKSQ